MKAKRWMKKYIIPETSQKLFITKLPTPFWGQLVKHCERLYGFSTIFMPTIRLGISHTSVVCRGAAYRLWTEAEKMLLLSLSGTFRMYDLPNSSEHLIASQLNWQEMTLGALTAKAGLRPGWKKEIKGPSGPLSPTPTSQLTSSPVSPGQTWSSQNSFPLYLSYVIPGDIGNKLVFSPCLKKKTKTPHHSVICWKAY